VTLGQLLDYLRDIKAHPTQYKIENKYVKSAEGDPAQRRDGVVEAVDKVIELV
jgi:hypothetical protein